MLPSKADCEFVSSLDVLIPVMFADKSPGGICFCLSYGNKVSDVALLSVTLADECIPSASRSTDAAARPSSWPSDEVVNPSVVPGDGGPVVRDDDFSFTPYVAS